MATTGLVFKVDEHGKLPPHVIYKIRQNSSFTDNTNLVREKYWTPGPNHARSVRYYQFAFVLIQDIIERAIIDKRVNRTVVEPGSYVQEFPYPCYIQDRFLFVIEHMFPIVMIISWVYYVAMLTQSIVYEKEQRLKEVMKMMGLSNAVHWVAWFITSFLEMSITIISLVCILKYGKVLTYSNPVIIWMFLSIFAIATIMFCFMVSSLFSKAKLAAACAGILYFISYVPYLYIALREEVVGEAIPFVSKSFASMLSTSAFGIGAKYFALYEEEGVGLQWSNLGRSPLEQDQFNLLHIMLIMIGDASLYFVVTWYVEAVHPGSYGLPRPWYFPFQKSYWFGHGSTESTQISFTSCFQFKRNNYNSLSVMEEDQACAMATASQDEDSKMEEEPVHLPLGVCIDKLVKVYKTGKLAVNKLSLNLYEGQITSFLGHNGAGKTTSMSILTGLIPPTSGTAVIYGHDIKTDMLQIRQSLGMCPQHNALFEKLTVEEHIWFYAKLKGTSSSDIDKEKNGLDEPTAGVDPYARRAIWDLLMKYKHGRTILLSTHHMDEADLLGDRIAIIANGQLKCCGSSLFLKSNYGNGYKLTIVKKPTDYTSADNTSMENLIELDDSSDVDDDNSQSRRPDVSSLTSYNSCTESVVTEFIQKDIPSATLTAENHHELSYVLPSEAAKKGTFEKLFDNLNDHIGELCISSYGLTDTSLEEVFMKVTQGSNSISDEDAMDKETFSLLSNSMATSPQNCIAVNSSRAQGTPETPGRSVRLCQSVRYSPPNASSLSTSDLSLSPVHPVNVEMCENVVEPTDDTGDVTLDEVYQRQLGEVEPLLNFGESLSQDIVNESNSDNSSGDPRPNQCLEGAGSYKLTGFSLTITQFVGLLLKRFHHSKRNWKGLFSQLLLPALFICIAMTVALLAPQVGDLPPLVLSPSQYHQLEHPEGNYIPYNNEAKYGSHYTVYKSPDGDAGPAKLASTLEISVGATCVLADTNKTDYYSVLKANSTLYFDKVLSDYDSMCLKSFYHHGILSFDYVSLSSRPAPVVHPLGPSPEDNIYEVDYMDYNTNNNETIQITEIPCQCAKDGHGFICPVEVGEPEPPTHRVITADIMLDVSGRNVSEYFLYTSDKYKLHRYGALSFGNVRPFVPPDFGGVVPVIYRKLAVRNSAVAWHNHKGFHSMPTYLNALNNAILRANLDPAVHGNPSAYGITVINHPMNKTSTRLSTEYINMRVYEVMNDLNYLVPAACCISILLLFDVPAYTSSTNLPAVILLFLLYGWSITPMMYTASFYFDVPSTAYVFLIVINLFTGITTVVAAFFLELFSDDKDLKQIGTTLNAIFLMFPNYCLGRGLMDVAYNDYFNEYYYRIGAFDKMHTPFEWQLTSRMLVVMAIEGLVFFVLTLLIEYRFFIKPRKLLLSRQSLPDEDEDVAKERQRVMRGDADNDLLKLHNLTKVYKTRRSGRHLAVDRVCLGVPQGECFGLLGVNGAGKTTTFKMLTGDELITRGEAFLNGHNIATEIHSVHQNIGYCPQFDALFDELTAKEHLMLYARLRGIPHHEQKQVVDWALRKLALLQYADKPAGTFSGGNKRKLSTAIALLGHPPVIFMDEPTTGMDPHSRRFLWDLILNIIKGGRSVILTSHSMEECEALCTRLAIMVNGHFKCLGSIQHLKNRFGDGYTITIRVKGGSRPNLQPVVRYFARNFPSAILKEKHHNMVQYDLKSEDNVSLATIFSQMKVMEDLLNIEDYSVSQTTLDNVFINFAKLQCEGGADDSPVITRRVPTELQDLLNEEYLQDEDSEDFTVRFDERESHLAFNMEIV
uniref:ATP-binding cassette sub-family A member 2-like n=1 Tax=Saccoglossus kowalevskii TaxID=10224 RepID=A0ABM0MBD6_SACKO|nr:PREDICTED: ATP-binding cassette sub-family A member 2-like [Saccoglossus kowalevskii]